MGLDDLLGWTWHPQTQNCVHFAEKVWLIETGEDLQGVLSKLTTGRADREVTEPVRRRFRQLDSPKSPCFVLMRHGKGTPHVGVYIRGRIAHLTEVGASITDPTTATAAFTRVTYYQ